MLISFFILIFIFSKPISAQIKINEIHPNPETSSEWVELLYIPQEETLSLENYSLHDNYHQIYLFSDEIFDQNNLLTVEVSGLNNGEDQILLKSPTTEIIDQFSYTKTEKGLSWTWIKSLEEFQITSPSKNLPNPSPTPTATPSPSPTPTNSPVPTPSSTKKPSSTTPQTTPTPFKLSYSNYIPSKIKLTTDPNPFLERKTRMVFLQERADKKLIINAIMGGSLVSSAAYYLIYVRIKKH